VTAIPGTPPPVDGPFGPLNLLPQSEMTATATSQGNAANGPSGALDGNCATMWHSNWSPHAPLPQYITLDLGQSRAIEALVYTPRQDAAVPNGRISSYDVQVSADGNTWQSVATGNWDGTVAAKIAPLPRRYYGPLRPADRFGRRRGLCGGYRTQYCSNVLSRELLQQHRCPGACIARRRSVLDAEHRGRFSNAARCVPGRRGCAGTSDSGH
jgi:hypothetical protein